MFRFTGLMTTLLLLALLVGCSAFTQEPRITIKGATLAGLDSSGVDVNFSLGITNPNAFDLSLLGYTYDLRVMTLPISTGRTLMTVNFPAGEETDMCLPVHLNFSDLLDIIKHQPDFDKLPYRINANLHIKNPLGDVIVPIEKADTLNIPERYRPDAAIMLLQNALRGIR